jgi:Ser/Thr protein kinase RdoA (MazF antagonist)
MAGVTSAWGEEETQFFYELTPEVILDAAEKIGLRCTGRVLPLNSMENRVYEVEIQVDLAIMNSPSEASRVIKFYRPGRWTPAQILEEHAFLADLKTAEVPVISPLLFADGTTLQTVPKLGIHCAVFAKQGGRHPQEMTEEQLLRVGRLMARLHLTGAQREASYRLTLNPETYGGANLDYLWESESLPEELEETYSEIVEEICEQSAPWFAEAECQRIHGDCHLGNLIWDEAKGPFWVDFDDMVNGPCVQDLWLITPDRDAEGLARREALLNGYEELRTFDRRSLRLIEPLRALRLVHFSAWIAKRWDDPAFPRKFEFFGTERYWNDQLQDLRECLELMQG